MSLSGALEDVTIADVLQFVHLGERSGTLVLERGALRAEIVFYRGRIINAQGPGSARVGELLLTGGVVTQAQIDAALKLQRGHVPPLPLGQALLQLGAIDPASLRAAIRQQIEQVVYDLLTWSKGAFAFHLDEIRPVDDLSIAPGEIVPDFHINTQLVLMEAARIFDERRRLAAPAVPAAPEALTSSGAPAPRPAAPAARLQVVSPDAQLCRALDEALAPQGTRLLRVTARDAGSPLPGEAAPVVLCDLRAGGIGAEGLSSIKRSRPRALVIALLDPGASPEAAFRGGALATVHAEVPVIVACLQNALRQRTLMSADHVIADGLRAGFARLRRVLAEFRSGLLSATVSLNLMNVISESVERAVLFLVRRDDLVVLGAFGTGRDGVPLSERTRGLRLALDPACAITSSLAEGRPVRLAFRDAGLPADFADLLRPPATGECAIFPVLGGQRVIAVIYADNGPRHRAIDEMEFLELATAQVGVAYENELLRRQAVTRPERAEALPGG